MNTPYVRAPHQEGSGKSATHTHTAPNAALLIDFDNVTMGMRSDLSHELKTLLNSDIIKGKVAVQRAYADWRRYPQYIVPLSEASIDLIFAPAYGSNKKNATDIRMAIDALELIFIRPEIGTFILLTGDSDFSSLVLKLKEYGKYVIGVGIQESSSDILVQNCDEYYSYTSLAGLRKTTEADTEPVDPWLLVERSLERMESRNDVMRSDRLKQVMLEIDAGFDESEYGFSKFSKFLTEASSRGLVDLKKLDNGQYEVRPSGRSGGGGGGGRGGGARGGRGGGGGSRGDGAPSGGSAPSGSEQRGGRAPATRSGRGRATRPRGRTAERKAAEEKEKQKEAKPAATTSGEPLQEAYDLLTDAVETLTRERDADAVRDSDVKRKMLDRDRSFDEAELGFSKFSRFLQQADEHDVIVLRQRESGNFEVALPGAVPAAEAAATPPPPTDEAEATTAAATPGASGRRATGEEKEPEVPDVEPKAEKPSAEPAPRPTGVGRGFRTGERGGRKKERREGPPILEGQVVGRSAAASGDGGPGGDEPRGGAERKEGERESARPDQAPSATSDVIDPDALGLPTDRSAAIRYLANSYRGVGEKTAETLVAELGPGLFEVLQRNPDRIRDVVPSNRAEQLLDAWEDDFSRRKSRLEESEAGDSEPASTSGGGSGTGAADEAAGTQATPGADRGTTVQPSGGPSSGPRSGAEDEEEDDEQPAPSRLGRRGGRRTRR